MRPQAIETRILMRGDPRVANGALWKRRDSLLMRQSKFIERHIFAAILTTVLIGFVAVGPSYASKYFHRGVRSHNHAGQSAKDQEIAHLKAEVQQLEYDLAEAQAKIDSLETQSVPQQSQTSATPSTSAAPVVTVSDARAERFPGGDSQGDPLWVVTFELKNSGESALSLPSVYLNCTDNNIGTAVPYTGNKGIIVVDPATISPSQDLHLKYAWVATTPSETPSTVTINFGASNVVEPLTLSYSAY
jgi:hypothetical protein